MNKKKILFLVGFGMICFLFLISYFVIAGIYKSSSEIDSSEGNDINLKIIKWDGFEKILSIDIEKINATRFLINYKINRTDVLQDLNKYKLGQMTLSDLKNKYFSLISTIDLTTSLTNLNNYQIQVLTTKISTDKLNIDLMTGGTIIVDLKNYDATDITKSFGEKIQIGYSTVILQTVEYGDNLGKDSSLALDSLGKAHISQQDFKNKQLRYCNNTAGSWSCTNIVGNTMMENYGTSIAIDSNDKIHVVTANSTNTIVQTLIYCNNTAGSWSCTRIPKSFGWYPSIAIDKNNVSHVAFGNISNNAVGYCNNSGGIWSCQQVSLFTSTNPYYTEIALDSNNKAHITYYNATIGVGGKHHYCNNTAGSWSCVTVDEVTSDVGTSASIALDSNNKAHTSSQDTVNGVLRYCNNTAGSWSCINVETEIPINNHGGDSSIAVDYNDKIHITHADATDDKLRYCNNTAGSWSCGIAANLSGNGMGMGRRNLAIKIGRIIDAVNYSAYSHVSYFNNITGLGGLFYAKIQWFFNPPNINITYPSNNTNYSNIGLNVNYSISINKNITDAVLGSCWYSNDTMSKNTTLASCSNITTITWKSSNHNVTIWTNNSIGNLNFSSISFRIDTGSPSITINKPSANQWLNNKTVNFSLTPSDDTDIDTCELWGNWTGTWEKNYTWITKNNILNSTTVNITSGNWTMNFWCNDTLGNNGWAVSPNRSFGIDIINPNITGFNITTTQNSKTVNFNLTISDNINLGTCLYSVFDAVGGLSKANTSFNCGETTGAEFITDDYASYNLTIFANDSAGNSNVTKKSFTTEYSAPGTGGGGGSSPFESPKEKTFCGNLKCEKPNDYGQYEDFWNCQTDCTEGFNFDEFIKMLFNYCRDGDPGTICFWTQGLFSTIYSTNQTNMTTICGDGICNGNENVFSCKQDCGKINLDTIVTQCFDDSKLNTPCFWDSNFGVTVLFVGLILGITIVSLATSKSVRKSIPKYFKNIEPKRKKRRRR